MGNTELPAAIRAFIDTTNAGDTEGFVAAFTEDAYLSDWGREFHGRDGVRSWNRTDNIGKQAVFSDASAVGSPEPDAYAVNLQVAGSGYNGTGNMQFRLRGNLIQSLVIS